MLSFFVKTNKKKPDFDTRGSSDPGAPLKNGSGMTNYQVCPLPFIYVWPCPVLFSSALVAIVRPVAECEQRTPAVEIEPSKPCPIGTG